MSKDEYVFKNQNKQAVELNGFEVLENDQMQSEQTAAWEMMDKNASTYHTGYDKHMSMQRKVKGMAADKRGDNAAMIDIKTALAKLSDAMQSEIASTPMKFRVQMADTALIYESLIRSCNSFIKTAKKKTAIEKERLRMVKEVLAQAEKERIHFADMGSGMRIFEDRADGMILGNVLGGILADYRSMSNAPVTIDLETNVRKKKWVDVDGYYMKRDEDDTTEAVSVYKLNNESGWLDEQAKASIGMSRVCEFLGAGNLCEKASLCVGKDKNGKKYFGKKTDVAYPEANQANIRNLKNIVEEENEKNPSAEARIEYTGEALKQLSRLYMLRLIAGREDMNNNEDVTLVYSEKELDGKKIFTVTGAFLKLSYGYFSEKDASALKKGTKNSPALDGLPLPVVDAEFAVTILAMRPEDLGFLVEDLQLSKAQRKALISRVTMIQKTLSEKMAREEQLPIQQRSIIKPSEWDNPDALAELQNKCATGRKVMFPEMLGNDVRIEGGGSEETELERKYFTVFHTLKKKVQSEKDPQKACLLLARIIAGAQYGSFDGFCDTGFEVGSDIATRLMKELITEDMLKGLVRLKYDHQKRVIEAYDSIAKNVKEVPDDFRNKVAIDKKINSQMGLYRSNADKNQPVNEEELRIKATAKVENILKTQYICYLAEKEEISLAVDGAVLESLNKNLGAGGYGNHSMNDKQLSTVSVMKKYVKKYRASHSDGEENFLNNTERGNSLYENMDIYDLLDKQKVEEIKNTSRQELIKTGLNACSEVAHLMHG